MWQKIKVLLWRLIYTPYYRIKYLFTYPTRKKLRILNSEDTILYITKHRCSVSRFGDGEFQMITHYLKHGTSSDFHGDTFQCYSPLLAERLLEVYQSNMAGHLLCIPYAFKKSSVYKGYGRTFFEREWLFRKDLIVSSRDMQIQFGDSCFTRFYMGRTDIRDYPHYITLLKRIWDRKDIVLLEGEQSRLGVGNDLFDNVVSIQRFLFPSTNAYDKYEKILEIVKIMPKNKLYLIALGHTATVLAYDMCRMGFWALDIGHVDVEYEWMRVKAKRKIAIPNKYVNEVDEGRITTELNNKDYQAQIIGRMD